MRAWKGTLNSRWAESGTHLDLSLERSWAENPATPPETSDTQTVQQHLSYWALGLWWSVMRCQKTNAATFGNNKAWAPCPNIWWLSLPTHTPLGRHPDRPLHKCLLIGSHTTCAHCHHARSTGLSTPWYRDYVYPSRQTQHPAVHLSRLCSVSAL